jgi:hypothetical protein
MNKTFIYHGEGQQPEWNPSVECIRLGETSYQKLSYPLSLLRANAGKLGQSTTGHSVILQNAITAESAQNIIDQFEARPKYAVSVSGYPDDEKVGSQRANAWATDLAEVLNPLFSHAADLPNFSGDGRSLHYGWDTGDRNTPPIDAPFSTENTDYSLIGTTPWMRFMKYSSNESKTPRHVPHFDAPYFCKEEQYITLYSWVLYLNDLKEGDGGRLQFIDDGYTNIHEQDRPTEAFSDWREMADPGNVIYSLAPKRGTLIIFPHWVCHQVENFVGDVRYMIRGDVAYSINPRKVNHLQRLIDTARETGRDVTDLSDEDFFKSLTAPPA